MNKPARFEKRKRARRRALQAIYQWQITAQDAREILKQFREVQDLSQIDEPYFEQLLYGVTTRKETIDQTLEPFLDRPLSQVDVMECVVLRMGIWELLYSLETPFRVVLDESVDLAQRFGSEQGHAFVNAVLDHAARELRKDEFKAVDKSTS